MEVLAEKKFPAEHDALPEILAWVEEQSSTCLAMKEAMRMQLAAEEAIVNIISYAYENLSNVEKIVKITYVKDEDMLCMELLDFGKPFNQLEKVNADASLSLEERELGGWGRPFIVKMTDKADYSYDDERRANVLRLYKKLL